MSTPSQPNVSVMKWYNKPLYTLLVIPLLLSVVMVILSPLILNPLCNVKQSVTLKGRVIDKNTQKNIPNVSIVVEGSVSTQTNNDGYFEFEYLTSKPRLNGIFPYLCQDCEKETVINAKVSSNGKVINYIFALENKAIENNVSENNLIEIE